MTVSREFSESAIKSVLQGKDPGELAVQLQMRTVDEFPLPPSLPRESVADQPSQETRLRILEGQGIRFEYLTGRKRVEDPGVFQSHIENYIGIAQLPVGAIGPLRINGVHAHGDFYVPLATSEGALIASYNRGAKIASLSGGVRAFCLTERVSRAPGFLFADLIQAGEFIVWVIRHFENLREEAQKTTTHGHLEDMKVTLEGNHVFLHFEYTTGDAAGQNMVTIATEAACRFIVAKCPVKPKLWFVESNMSGDKKATALSFLSVRGKKVIAETVIPRNLIKRMLHTTPEMMMEYWKMSFVGGVQTGSIGVQGHYANGLAAMFIACGQDAACVAEASVGLTRLDLDDNGDLYISVSLPNLIVGTIGGGTGLPTQKECLAMLGCTESGSARKFAEICAAVALAGEISIMGALSSGQFTQAHIKYGRKTKK
ncbi:MAG: hydroxymethylglutaryl-CoA reductase [Syntrophotalea acetylenica]|jgi:hydroxymethylglutaryl-CoA reductase (NADPH)|nr:hydroxymethylglutaryl-CoA reductase [Syntrophotalea acetylenica]